VETPPRTCTIEGCRRDVYAQTVCTMHYYRIRRTGNPGPPERIKPDRGPGKIGYMAAHKRVYRTRGPAKQHPCATGCGRPADQWSYMHRPGSHEMAQYMEGAWLYFSPDPDDYDPLCRTCHIQHDQEASPNWNPQRRLPPHDPGTPDVIVTREKAG
jgi:hypothetical protein